ncbi:signal transduction histidine kinase [Parabacteroides sp. PFB2-10]|uniref:tetratricopeptide repeat-containing sensor histidine kinase n=1 Tax=Parabacteroides sp. PFB2-10 TaxID=1742405 RepID=UPI002476092E|nr:HAMP domain-containing sensor histidine kinase [Parabacteroides sp. PFB2-10]MDH6312193.1 signal transduction histidine kinase [Parabacteroides sp. PFB2-10]
MKNIQGVPAIVFCLLLLFSIPGEGQNPATVDSLKQLVESVPDSERLAYLNDRLEENLSNPNRQIYAYWLEEEAQKQKNEAYLANALFGLVKHFYGNNQDSMRQRAQQLYPLLLKQYRYEDFFRVKGWDVYMSNRRANKVEALTTIEEIRKLSEEYDFPEGLEIADQALADFYFSNDMYDEAEQLYLSVMRRMEARNAPPVKIFNIYRQLFNRPAIPEKRIAYLSQGKVFLEKCRKEGMTHLDKENSILEQEYVIHRFLAREYTTGNQLEKAWTHLQLAQQIADQEGLHRAKAELGAVYALYYLQKGESEKAMTYILELEKHNRTRGYSQQLHNVLSWKATALEKLGRLDESLRVTREMLVLKDSINRQEFNATLANIRTKNEVERLELEGQRMEAKAKQTRQLMIFLLVGCSVLLLVIVVLINMMRILRRRREELRIAKEKAEEADALKSTFLANMNHEIRTPLNAIVGFSQILIEEEGKEAREEFAGIIQNNNELLQRLIGDVLDISKIESDSMSLVYSVQDIPVLMKDVYNMLSFRVSEQVKFTLAPCEALTLDTDRNRLIQIITNLLTNAIKHTSQGEIRFGYDLQGENVRFYVEDTGEGIPENQLESIFDRFAQLQNGKKGVGLGLAICKGLVTKMGGRIWATSEVGVGSTFYVLLPAK